MSYKSFAGYVQAIFGGLLFAAIVFLVLMQWNNNGKVWIYGLDLQVNTGLLMVCSAVGGVVLVWSGRAMWRGIAAVRRARPKAKTA